MPKKIVYIIRNSYDGVNCKMVYGGQLTDSFEVKASVRQGCLLPPFRFLLVIDWITKTPTTGEKHEIQWTAWMQLHDLDFIDDMPLLSHTQQQMQKTTSVAAASAAATVGLNINKGKSKILRYNTACNNPIILDGEDLEDVETFTYLSSMIDEHGGSHADVNTRIGSAEQEKHIYKCRPSGTQNNSLSTNTKVRISNTIVKTVLLHYQQQPTVVGENKPDPIGGINQEESLEVDGTHIEESTELRHKTSPHLESSMSKEKTKAKEHITPGNGDRHEKNEQELDGTRKEGPGQSGLKNAGWRPMLHWE
ncbi:unnamed protein product [Schistosoma margrebowiei]|uniref:Uncharacterized protein n=1 Tax=Schistosoma margrebowiei TaxID=48269 RepID=A0A183MZQ3_9TREM|nr:unnamed protein product [Schistosoma margrebowiei]